MIYEQWYDYAKPKYGGKAKLCHADPGNLWELAGDVEIGFDT